MDKSQTISGIGHAVVITWIVLGDWLFAPREVPPPDAVQVSMVSESELQAMMDAAPKTDLPPADTPATEPAVKPPEPVKPVPPTPAPTPAPPPKPAADPVAAPEPPPEVPVAPDPQPIEAPPAVAPIAAQEQPVPTPPSTKKPKPRPIDRVAVVPVESPVKTPDVADQVVPDVTDQPAPDAPVVPEKKPPAAPQEATTQVVTEDNTATDAPQLAPTTSRRPQTRPEKPVAPVKVAADSSAADAQAKADAKAVADATAAADAQAQAEADAVAAALAAAADTGGAQNVPEGPPMSQSEIEGLHVAINKCWNTGTMSTEALNTTIQIRVEMKEDGKPDYASIKMTGFSGGTEAAAQVSFQVARKAVVLCGKSGYDLDPAKYGQWNVLNMTFDPNGMRLR